MKTAIVTYAAVIGIVVMFLLVGGNDAITARLEAVQTACERGDVKLCDKLTKDVQKDGYDVVYENGRYIIKER